VPELALVELQRWMQGVVVHPSSVDEAVAEAEQGGGPGVEQVILPSRTLLPVERVGIYHGMYLLRMLEALEADYPALAHFLGHERFRDLVHGYVQAFPSRCYTLNRLGDHLPEYLGDAPDVPRRAFCQDLARLELAVTEAFDAPETPPLDEAAIAQVAPDAWDRARLVPVASLRLLALRYPASEYLETVRSDDHDHPKARLKNNWVAVYRRDYAVRRLLLERGAFHLLGDLAAGQPLGAALAAAVARGGRRGPGEERLFAWFRQWMTAGIFQKVEL